MQRPPLAGVAIALAVFLLVAGLRQLGGLQAAELVAGDLFLNLKPATDAQDARIAVVLIDDEDIRRLGRWPISDNMLADLIERLAATGPAGIGFDLYRDLPVAPGTERLERVLTDRRQVVFVMKFGGAGAARVGPPPVLAGTDRIGFADLIVDPGGFVRRGLLFLDDGQDLAYAFSLRLALPYLAARGVQPAPGATHPEHLRLGSVTFPPLEAHDGPYMQADANGYQFLIDYLGGPRPIRSYTLRELIDGHIPAGALKDRIVLVGVSADSVKDSFLTPFNHRQRDAAGTPGVLIHARAVSQLLRAGLDGQRPMAFLPGWVETVSLLVWCLLAAGTALRLRALPVFLGMAAAETALLAGGAYAAFLAGWWIPVVPLVLAGLACAGLSVAYLSSLERNERRYLMDIFSKQVSADVAEEMWRSRDQFLQSGRLQPRLLTATILFTDLHNFTPVAERLSPPELMDWLNLYMDRMAGLVMEHGGVVDDYFGDAIKANFGVPIPRTDPAAIDEDARRAVRCALAMGRALEVMNRDWEKAGLPRISMRVGIATGEVVAGCLGSTQRMKFTTLGDIVNTAARLETYGKEDPRVTAPDSISRVLISQETARRLGDRFTTLEVGALRLKGKDTVVTVCRVEGETTQAPVY